MLFTFLECYNFNLNRSSFFFNKKKREQLTLVPIGYIFRNVKIKGMLGDDAIQSQSVLLEDNFKQAKISGMIHHKLFEEKGINNSVLRRLKCDGYNKI